MHSHIDTHILYSTFNPNLDDWVFFYPIGSAVSAALCPSEAKKESVSLLLSCSLYIPRSPFTRNISNALSVPRSFCSTSSKKKYEKSLQKHNWLLHHWFLNIGNGTVTCYCSNKWCDLQYSAYSIANISPRMTINLKC